MDPRDVSKIDEGTTLKFQFGEIREKWLFAIWGFLLGIVLAMGIMQRWEAGSLAQDAGRFYLVDRWTGRMWTGSGVGMSRVDVLPD